MRKKRVLLLLLCLPILAGLVFLAHGWIVLTSDPPPLPLGRRIHREGNGRPREPLRLHGNVQESRIIRRVEPDYPELARQMRWRPPFVKIQAAIGTDGRITGVKILRGHPLCDEAAMRAVAQWRFTPTLFNGVPTEVHQLLTLVCGDPYHGILDPAIALVIDAVRQGSFTATGELEFVHDDRADVTITLAGSETRAAARLAALGFVALKSDEEDGSLSGSIPVRNLDAVRKLPGVSLIAPYSR